MFPRRRKRPELPAPARPPVPRQEEMRALLVRAGITHQQAADILEIHREAFTRKIKGATAFLSLAERHLLARVCRAREVEIRKRVGRLHRAAQVVTKNHIQRPDAVVR